MVKPGPAAAIEARYQNSFGRAAGYLPRNRKAVDAWLTEFVAKARKRTADHVDSVKQLEDLLNSNKVLKDLVNQMIDQAQKLDPQQKHKHVKSIDEMLNCLDEITVTAPEYRLDPNERVFFPMSALFCYMMATQAGWEAFRNEQFNDKLLGVLSAWCAFLDSPDSRYVLNEGPRGWLCQAASEQNKLYEFVIPEPGALYGGFASFNAFFNRHIKPEFRPNGAKDDPQAVVSPNDGSVVRFLHDVQEDADITLKGQPYALRQMLNGYEHTDKFVGGDVFQSFLSGANYHRWHAPVDGRIVHVERVPGLTFSELQTDSVDTSAGTLSQGYQANVNTRGLVVIESTVPDIGYVCVIPVGITEISSVRFSVGVGDRVTRGDELGYFSYGGSSMALVFEPGKVDFTVPNNTIETADDGAPLFVNSTIATAK
ncbi:phosphatidylserine decarboxylase family protein [Streptomyces roseoverticillatus]|uniref:phosphatidylserine decarboxylase family protein n=1 Tax=Streptomyces roseoverticillatus TaxID=66429 RepID=UPI001F1AB2BB|nr:phosphatidylserine decarboxylase family protein [Streptomyces roseoverticillatus]MCF3101277.1 phosphatidylserine decarboxylase family protein [Streptomyces roseoverticillatus]